MSDKLVYLNQLQDATYASLSKTDFSVAVIDKDDANLTGTEIDTIQSTGKKLISYLSIGEAEEYRDYWIDNNWENNAPDFLVGDNQLWDENHLVKFWEQAWQDLMKEEVTKTVEAGYTGMYLDLIEVYQVEVVEAAYVNQTGTVRQEMVDFVIELSAYAKGLNAEFQVIANNGTDLFCTNPWDISDPNEAYLAAIDGLGKEDLWYYNDTVVENVQNELSRIELATSAGKYVVAIDYPTDTAKQETFINNALQHGIVPFVGLLDLGATIAPINYTIVGKLPEDLAASEIF